jgi:beta-glucosidase
MVKWGISAILVIVVLLSATCRAQAPVQSPLSLGEQIKLVQAMPFRDSRLSIEQRVDDLVSRMTLEEKVSQLMDRAASIPRLGVPGYNWWNEGLHGIARSGFATVFPQAIGNAATWDAPLVSRISTVVSTEARAKYNDAISHGNRDRYFGLTIWSPNINIFRDPRWGRGQETYGEDPFLTSRLGIAFVKGIQGDDPSYFRAIATPKHFAVHSGPETTRHRVDVDPSDHDLWDTYLPAFRATIVEGGADSIMCAYNAIDKDPACASKLLLHDILRKEWNFQGYVTSDCDAINDFSQPNGHHYSTNTETGSVAGIEAGTDLDCGAAYRALTDAVHHRLISESQLDVSVKRLITARMRLGMFDPPAKVAYASIPFSVVNSSQHQALALQAARESMVLLKNDESFLPLKPDGNKTIAVIGPLAASRIALEGNYYGAPLNPILPVDGMASEYGASHILYAEGAPYLKGGDVPVPRTLFRTATNPSIEGLTGEYFARASLDGRPSMTRVDKEIDFDWASANPVSSSDTAAYSFAVRWSGTIAVGVAETDEFQIHLPGCYPCAGMLKFAIYLDGKPLEPIPSRVTPAERGAAANPRYSIAFADTKPRVLRIEYTQSGRIDDGGITFDWTPRYNPLREEALATAKKADVIVAFVGLTSRVEGEEMDLNVKGFSGGDRTDIVLPDVQEELIETLARTGKPMVVVLMNGSALAVNWAEQNAKAIVEAWYPGESGGQAIAETLSGKYNPAGRLPVTFYAGVDQLPPFEDYSMNNRTYRYFNGKPLYHFGDGLSYTTFAYSNLRLSTSTLLAGGVLTVEADVTNTGSLAGDEVAQLYIVPPKTSVSPNLALAGFERLSFKPGETKHVSFRVDSRSLSQVDVRGLRTIAPGRYRVFVGGSQPAGDRAKTVRSADFTVVGAVELPR